jgi:membrane fusion protein
VNDAWLIVMPAWALHWIGVLMNHLPQLTLEPTALREAPHPAVPAPTASTGPMVPPLFRPEAIVAAAGTQIGEALAAHWRGVRAFSCAAFLLVALLIAFLGSVEYAPGLRIYAYIDSRSGLVRLKAPIDGRIVSIAVKEGQRVRVGDTIAIISRDREQADGASQHTEIRSKLAQERDLLDHEMENARLEAVAARLVNERRIAGLRSEKATLATDLQSAERLLASAQLQCRQTESLLDKGFVSTLQVTQKRDEVTAQESRVASARAALTRVTRDIETSEAERGLVETKRFGAIEDLRRSAIGLERLAVQSDADAQEIVRAPRDGTVFSALIVSGQSVVAGERLFTIAPVDSALVLRVLVPARAAAAVRSGIAIKMAFQAYPEERFGQFPATIESVSDAPAMPEDVPRASANSEPVFISLASWSKELRAPDGHALWLKPGMLADAIVPLERRTMLAWLFAPMLRSYHEGARAEQPEAMQRAIE